MPDDSLPPSRWLPIIAYALVSAANQMLWLTFTPVTTGAASYYGVSEGAVGWLAEIFPLLYVVLALPTGKLIDRYLRLGLGAGAVLTAAGALLRLAGPNFAVVLLGQVIIAVAQPLILNSVTKLSGGYLRSSDRATGIAVSSAGIFAGMVVAMLLGSVLSDSIPTLLLVQAALSCAAAAAMVLALRRPAVFADAAPVSVPLRTVWSDGYIRLLTGLVCVGFGVFIALTTWLQALLEPSGVSASEAGVLLLLMVVAGVLGSALVAPWVARRGRTVLFITLSLVAGVIGALLLAIAPGMVVGVPVLIVLGVFLLTDLPVVLELAERRAGPAGGTATALLWLAGNAAGLVSALIVQQLLGRPALGFVVLAVLLLPGFPMVRRLARHTSPPLDAMTDSPAPADS